MNDNETDDNERYAKVHVVGPDGSVEDTVVVQFGYDQPLGIDPLEHSKEGRWPDDYKLRLRYLVIDGVTYYENQVDDKTHICPTCWRAFGTEKEWAEHYLNDHPWMYQLSRIIHGTKKRIRRYLTNQSDRS